jgi:hypothetical protein
VLFIEQNVELACRYPAATSSNPVAPSSGSSEALLHSPEVRWIFLGG